MTNPETWAPLKGARIDFAAMLTDIAYLLGEPMPGGQEHVRVPVSQEKLAEHLQVPRGTLRMWMNGSQPRHAEGEMLLGAWCRLSGKARTFAPVDRFVFSASKAGAPAPIRTTNDKPRAAGALLHAVCMRWPG